MLDGQAKCTILLNEKVIFGPSLRTRTDISMSVTITFARLGYVEPLHRLQKLHSKDILEICNSALKRYTLIGESYRLSPYGVTQHQYRSRVTTDSSIVVGSTVNDICIYVKLIYI